MDKKENPYKLKKIKCPFCDKVFAESSLEYDFNIKGAIPTNRHICHGCHRSVLYIIKPCKPTEKENTIK